MQRPKYGASWFVKIDFPETPQCTVHNSLDSPIITPRLRAELRKLRKMYEEQTTKAKNEYMLVHSKQV